MLQRSGHFLPNTVWSLLDPLGRISDGHCWIFLRQLRKAFPEKHLPQLTAAFYGRRRAVRLIDLLLGRVGQQNSTSGFGLCLVEWHKKRWDDGGVLRSMNWFKGKFTGKFTDSMGKSMVSGFDFPVYQSIDKVDRAFW